MQELACADSTALLTLRAAGSALTAIKTRQIRQSCLSSPPAWLNKPSLCALQSWGSVYYFCGERNEYCTCSMRWNAAGWAKAAIIWCFILTAALGVQKLAIQAGLDGLLAGALAATCIHVHTHRGSCWQLQGALPCSVSAGVPFWLPGCRKACMQASLGSLLAGSHTHRHSAGPSRCTAALWHSRPASPGASEVEWPAAVKPGLDGPLAAAIQPPAREAWHGADFEALTTASPEGCTPVGRLALHLTASLTQGRRSSPRRAS